MTWGSQTFTFDLQVPRDQYFKDGQLQVHALKQRIESQGMVNMMTSPDSTKIYC